MKANDEVRAATRRSGSWASMCNSVSVRPSEKYSLPGSLLMFTKGNTATEGLASAAAMARGSVDAPGLSVVPAEDTRESCSTTLSTIR